RGLDDAGRIVVSSNRRYLYTAGYSPMSVAVLTRHTKTGLLAERGSPRACYTPSGASHHAAGLCRRGRALRGGYAGSMAPDGRTLYFASQKANGFVVFRVDETTGAFFQLTGTAGCVTE